MNRSKIYSEVYYVIEALGDKYKNRISKRMMKLIEDSMDKDYVVKIDKNKGLNEQGLDRMTLSMIARIDLDYWCETELEKKELMNKLIRNEEEASKRLYNNIFNK